MNKPQTIKTGTTLKVKVKQIEFSVFLQKEQGGYFVQCRELRGALSQGDTKREAIRNIREAIEGYLEAFPGEMARLRLKS